MDASFLTPPGGGLPASELYSFSGSNPNITVPLYDIFGSTLGLVYASNPGTLISQYYYDPYGVVTTNNTITARRGRFCGMAWSRRIPTHGSSIGSRVGMYTIRIRSSFRSVARKGWAVAAAVRAASAGLAEGVAPENHRRLL